MPNIGEGLAVDGSYDISGVDAFRPRYRGFGEDLADHHR